MKLEIKNNIEQDSLNHNYSYGFDFKESNPEDMLREGVRMAQQGNRAKARHLLLLVTEAEPENETAWLWLASISEYPEELLIFLQNVLKVNPQNERAVAWLKETKSLLAKTFVHRGIDASHQNQTDFAKQCFLQAIAHEAENEMAWLWLASMTEAVEEKMLYLQKVLNFNPQNETALTSLNELKKQNIQSQLRKANSAAIAGDKKTADSLLEEIMKNSPELEEAWILKAYLTDGFYEKLGCYERVLEINPQNEAAQAGMSSLKILMEKVENKPEISQQIAALETSAQQPQESSDNTHQAVENIQESTPDFVEEPLQIADFEAESIHPPHTESVLSESGFAEQITETKPATSEENDSANYLNHDAQISNLELSTNEHNFSDEEVYNSMDEDFHAEISTQNLEEAPLAQTNFSPSDETEIELIETHLEENASFPQTEEPAFSLEVEENSETYLIEDTQIPNSYEPNLYEDPQNDALSLSEVQENEVEETSFETTEESTETNAYVTEESSSNDFPISYAEEKPFIKEYIADYNQPTVEFSYNEVSPVFTAQSADPVVEAYTSEHSDSENSADELSETKETVEDSADEMPLSAAPESVETSAETQTQVPNAECPFCGFSNEFQTINCGSCRTMLSLSDLEMLLAHQDADQGILAQSIKIMEEGKSSRAFDTDELSLLGVAYLNAKNLRKGLEVLQEASKINPNDVVLSSKVNFLAIRISEIELQENKYQESVPFSRTIMVVDDSATVRKLISGKLEKSGHSVVTAVDGIEALSKINESVPDLILLDISMPQMDGYQVCKLIRNNEATKDIPVVMISGKDGFFDKVRGRMAGSTDYITKPFGPETLMKTIETYLN